MMKALLTVGIVAAILAAIVVAELGLDRFRPATGRWPRLLAALLIAAAIAAVAIALLRPGWRAW